MLYVYLDIEPWNQALFAANIYNGKMENGKNSKSIRMLEVLSILLLKEGHVYEIILKNSYSENKFYFIIFHLLYYLGCSLIFFNSAV